MRLLGSAALLLAAASLCHGSGAPALFDGKPLGDTLQDLAVEAGVVPQLFHYHFDVAAPGTPEPRDPSGGASSREGLTLPSIKRTASFSWDERPVGWRSVTLAAKVRIDYGFSPMLFVSPKLAGGSCEWSAAHKRELAYADAFSKIFVQSIPDLKSALEAEAARLDLPSPAAPAVLKEGEASRRREAAAEGLRAVLERHAAQTLAKMEAERARLDAGQGLDRTTAARSRSCSSRSASVGGQSAKASS